MADEKLTKKGLETYALLCRAMDEKKWKYQKEEKDLAIFISFDSDDLPVSFKVVVDAERQLVSLFSLLPFKMCEDKRIDGAIATCEINYLLSDGSFDYNIGDGSIGFRMTATYRDSLLSTEIFKYLIDCACWTVDEYNDKLFAINKGYLTMPQFIEKILSDD